MKKAKAKKRKACRTQILSGERIKAANFGCCLCESEDSRDGAILADCRSETEYSLVKIKNANVEIKNAKDN